MKLKKIMTCICMTIMVLIILSGCVLRRMYVAHPSEQKNTSWSTEDGSVCFFLDENASHPFYSYINTPDGPIEIALYMSELVSSIEVAYAEDARNSNDDEPIPSFAVWHCTYYDEKRMDVVVTQTKHLTSGQELVFYRQ